MKIREIVERDLTDEPQSVVKVYETKKLKVDFKEYVLTDPLAREFAKVLEPIVESARPAGGGISNVGVWVSGFFGSGKSHFAKVVGHLIADTNVDGESARSMFRDHLKPNRVGDASVAELLQQADAYSFKTSLVPFDIATAYAAADAGNVGRTFLRKLYESIGLSNIIAFAERELELQRNGQYDDFLRLYEKKAGVSWDDDKHLAMAVSNLALCLSELLPERYTSQEAALQALNFELDHLRGLSITDVVKRMLRWLDGVEGETRNQERLLFVADEVGAWCGRDRNRIEQVRAFIEELGVLGQGRIWLLATSQERLSEVVANAPDQDEATAKDLQQRLEARFRYNVHIDPSEVGTVIEDRVLRKKPNARPGLEKLWREHEAQLAGIAQPPGLEMGGNYPHPDLDNFISDYPFLPYQMPAAAELFGAMRGPKVSSGARSMLKVVFDALQQLADDDLGRIVSWDQIFDSANRDNEFADEQYLGSQGLHYLSSADTHVEGTPVKPSRVLKTLWLIQRSRRIPRTVANVARLLTQQLDEDVSQIEQDLRETLVRLEEKQYVRHEAATGQWRFLTQDQVTVEKIVSLIAEDLRERDLRKEREALFSERLQASFNGRITHGQTATVFDYGVFIGETALKNDAAPVRLRLSLEGTSSAEAARNQYTTELDEPVVYWIAAIPDKLETRLKRALAIERLEADDEFRRVATDRTRAEARELAQEADTLRAEASHDVQEALERGELLWAGQSKTLPSKPRRGRKGSQMTIRPEVEGALRDRIDAKYHRFAEGDLDFSANNVDKVLTSAPKDRAHLDPDLRLFDVDGNLLADQPVPAALVKHLSTTTKNAGKDLIDHFRRPPFGWPADLVRYAAAALFVAGRTFAVEPSGKTIDDPRSTQAKALFGTGPFKTTRFEIEEEPLTGDERKLARDLLAQLDSPPSNDGEVELKEATLKATADLGKRTTNLEKAREVDLPLPPVYQKVQPILEELEGDASRAKLIRTLLSHADDLREIKAALDRLDSFVKHNGLTQYRRSQELLEQALEAGLIDDSTWGDDFQEAQKQYDAIGEQKRVLEEWDGSFLDYRSKVVEAYRAIYVPLREEAANKVDQARSSITSMKEFEELNTANRAHVRAEFLAGGRGLAEITVPELHDEEQLVAATRTVNIPFLRSRLAALSGQMNLAKTRVLELFTAQQEDPGAKQIMVWDPEGAFSGTQLTTEDEVDMVFDNAKDEVKSLIRDGKVVRIL